MVILRKKVAALSETSLESFALRARRAAGLHGVVNILVTTSAALRSLNRQFRGKDQATDVLSFPAAARTSRGRRGMAVAGEIAISADIAAQNAARFGHSPGVEVKILTLHGILHLAGFDHERDNSQMARKEIKLRRQLGLPIALIERTQRATPRTLKKRGQTRLSGTWRER